jgi:hypothetical protein
MPTLFEFNGYRVKETEVSHLARRYGRSKYNIRNRIFNTLFDMLAVRWLNIRHIEYELSDEIAQ